MTIDPTMSNQPFVTITLSKVYDEVTGMRAEFRELVAEVKADRAQGADHENRIRTVERDYVTSAELEKLAGRVVSLERFKWTVTPLAMALSGAVGAAVTKVMSGH